VFTLRSDTSSTVLEVSVPLGEDVPKLPRWLQIPYVPRVERSNTLYTPETCEPTFDRIRSGDMITDKHGSLDNYGSLGAILVERGEFKDEYYAITAGHVVAGGIDFEITQRITKKSINATVVPLRNGNPKDTLSAEVGILKLDSDDLAHIAPGVRRFHVSFYGDDSPTGFDNNIEVDFADARPRILSIERAQRRSSLFVFKDGASDGLTMGKLNGHRWTFSPRRNQHSAATADETSENDDLSDPDSDEYLRQEYLSLIQPETHRWVGFVEWTGCPFSVPGDSGALVYASDGAVKIPLGIHIGAPSAYEETSMFLSLESYLIEARLMGLHLGFVEEEV